MVRRHAETLGDDPLHHGVGPAALIGYAGQHLDAGIAADGEREVGGQAPLGAGACTQGHAPPPAGCRRAVPVRLLAQEVEHRAERRVPPLLSLAVDVADLDGVQAPEFEGVLSQRPRDEIDVGLGREGHLRLARRPGVSAGDVVGVGAHGVDPHVGQVVPDEGRQPARGHERGVALAGGVGAAVIDDVRGVGDDAAFGVDAGSHLQASSVPGVARPDVVGIPGDVANRPSG